MMKPTRFALASIVALSISSMIYAAETTSTSGEIVELFGNSSQKPVSAVVSSETAATIKKNEVTSSIQENKVATKDVAKTSVAVTNDDNEAIRPSARKNKAQRQEESVPQARVPMRGEQLAIALDTKKISYTLPKSIDDAQIELMSLDGKVISTHIHHRQDVGGVIDTTSLSKGYYILRLVDESGKKSGLTRALAINK